MAIMLYLCPAADGWGRDQAFAQPSQARMRGMQALLHPVGALHRLLQVILHLGQAISQLIPFRLDDLQSYGDLQKFPVRV
ncbi:hypothetical protein ABWH93_17000 [Seohaeicola saemankumensis]|uniref:hypothetical protein n=1 Tax=Seohaeicola TaxID=481178 RepID=UPI0035CFF19F